MAQFRAFFPAMAMSLMTAAGALAATATAVAGNADADVLDRRFGNRGTAHVFFDPTFQHDEWVRGSVVDNQGRIILAGTIRPPGDFNPAQHIAIARLLPDGSWDPDFGTGGLFLSTCDDGCGVHDVGVLDNGEIVVFMRQNGVAPVATNVLKKLLANGSGFDLAFGSWGSVALNDWGEATLDSSFLGIHFHLIVESPSTIVVTVPLQHPVVGLTTGVARLTGSGQLDATFNAGPLHGRRILAHDPPIPASALARQGDGKLVVVGASNGLFAVDRGVGVWRINADGSDDTGFGESNGVVFHRGPGWPIGAYYYPSAVSTVQWGIIPPVSRRIVILLHATHDDMSHHLLRLDEAGQIDSAFGNQGWADLQTPPSMFLYSMIVSRLQPVGPVPLLLPPSHVTIAGSHEIGPDGEFRAVVHQRRWNGTVETRFGDNGTARFDFDGGAATDIPFSVVAAIRAAPGGTAVVAGSMRISDDDPDEAYRYNFAASRIVLDRIFAGDQETD